ncbi:O-antigen ligase [Rothia sp. ZJ1223]|uniref:O-antigen ligase family protein n=1 Tax=Rothia sp. ZJ1223 TaxID=2811098 RepID=UPI0019574CAB|nr:O-antigen ligase domain-containing protein [Rothia sp. ZJ1223]MBM7051383.1 O-antigen ligase domain-containing protein [Rothia sp. ZJ1223]
MPQTVFISRSQLRKARLADEVANYRLAPLPAWPLWVLLYAFPVIWAMGLMQFAPTLLAAVMLMYMYLRRSIITFGPQWLWMALIAWCLLCVVALDSPSQFLGWALRFINIFNVGVYSLYFLNAREKISNQSMLGGLFVVWLTVVVMGYMGIFFPEARLITPMSYVLPDSLTRNELVRDYVMPPMAEVQMPWGAPKPYIRPSAPFPYANSWGLAYTFLTPVVMAIYAAVLSWRIRAVLTVLLCASVVPAIATSNRAMFIGLGVSASYVIFRQALKGRWVGAISGILIFGGAALYMWLSGAATQILGRQEYSDSTGGRLALYESTWEATLKSPFIGYGTSKMNYEIGVSMGTQGYMWALMFCFGLVGLGIFLLFIGFSIASTWRVQSSAGMWVHSLPIVTLSVFAFYSLDIMQLSTLMLCISLMMRSKIYGEGL